MRKLLLIPLVVLPMLCLCWSCFQQSDGMHLAVADNISNNEDTALFEATNNYKVITDIPEPKGYKRVVVDSGSFGSYLRSIYFSEDNIIYLFNGSEKSVQYNHIAVFDIDVGQQDLQQCADACMRLWGEYLYQTKQYDELSFNFLSDGNPRYYTEYASNDFSYGKFRKYMNYIFSYANTKSLYNELQNVSVAVVELGDVFIQTGNPLGHAVMVVDVAENVAGERIFLLAQSYMPAQSIHVLKNDNGGALGNWYKLIDGEDLSTPEFYFTGSFKLKRFGT